MLDATPQTPQNFDDAALLIVPLVLTMMLIFTLPRFVKEVTIRCLSGSCCEYWIGEQGRGSCASFDLITSSVTPAVGDEFQCPSNHWNQMSAMPTRGL